MATAPGACIPCQLAIQCICSLIVLFAFSFFSVGVCLGISCANFSSASCPAGYPKCISGNCCRVQNFGARFVCPECIIDAHCPSSKPLCAKEKCGQCVTNAECQSKPTTPICSAGVCIARPAPPPPPECTSSTDCKDAAKPVCTAGKCSPCSASSQCAAKSSAAPFCYKGTCENFECKDTTLDCTDDTKPMCVSGKCSACKSDCECVTRKRDTPYCTEGACTIPIYICKIVEDCFMNGLTKCVKRDGATSGKCEK